MIRIQILRFLLITFLSSYNSMGKDDSFIIKFTRKDFFNISENTYLYSSFQIFKNILDIFSKNIIILYFTNIYLFTFLVLNLVIEKVFTSFH